MRPFEFINGEILSYMNMFCWFCPWKVNCSGSYEERKSLENSSRGCCRNCENIVNTSVLTTLCVCENVCG